MKKFPPKQGVPGFLFSGIQAGIKPGRKDLGLILSTDTCSAAGIFTKNRVKAAPVTVCQKKIKQGLARAVIVNCGNANACTGVQGIQDAQTVCTSVAKNLHISQNLILPCSTGVIGVRLPAEKIVASVPELIRNLSEKHIPDFAEAILTTDTVEKICCLKDTCRGKTVKVCGIAKGAGMIMPNMATMLAFIVTDAGINAELLSTLLRTISEETFNTITVDGDMSTNDTVLALSNASSGVVINSARSAEFGMFYNLLYETMRALSEMIVLDGEGATKLLKIMVLRAASKKDARNASSTVANSLLVKTAFFGEDFNWGRIMASLGMSGAVFDPDKVDIYFNSITAVENGIGVHNNIRILHREMKKKRITVTIDLKKGTHTHQTLTTDLSHEYVDINASYTT